MKKITFLMKIFLAFSIPFAFGTPAGRVMIVADNIAQYLKETVAPVAKEKKIHVLIRAVDTDTALELVLKGETDIAAITRELYSEEKQKNPQFREEPIASDALVFVVHPSNPLDNLTNEQVMYIYTTKGVEWKEFIGSGHPLSEKSINPMSKTQQNGAFTAFMRYFKFSGVQEKGKTLYFQQYPNQKDTQKVSCVTTDQAAIAQLAVRKESIAFVSLTALASYKEGKDFKVIPYNKIAPSVKTTFNRTYPLTYRLNFVMDGGRTTPEAQAYLDWILDGEGQDLFRNLGLAPINLKTKIIQTTSSLTQFRSY
jgi:phosphate transport system substrate-binding protein